VKRSYGNAVRKACDPPREAWRYPDFHSLRRTCATALGKVSSVAITAKVLGHSLGTVTLLYTQPSFEDCLDALNRAARVIEAEPPGGTNVVPLKRRATAS